MANQLWKYHIGVYEGNDLKYVTSINGRCALWEDGKPAKEFGSTTATDICKGLNLNLIPAIVIKAPTYMELTN